MDFITEQEAIQAAKEGAIPALRCSLKHHRQGRDAPKFELIEAVCSGKLKVTGDLCACCRFADQKTNSCKQCLLYNDSDGHFCCNNIWQEVSITFNVFSADFTNVNYRDFQKAESEVCKYIEEVLAKEIAKEEKPELRHGDYGYRAVGDNDSCEDAERLILNDGGKLRYANDIALMDSPHHTGKYAVLGNIFDDLKRNSEDLEEFEVRGSGGGVKYKLEGGSIETEVTLGPWLSLEDMTKVHQKLGQLIATARRRNEKG